MTFKTKSTVELLQITEPTIEVIKNIAKILEPYNGRLPVEETFQSKKVDGKLTCCTQEILDCGLFQGVDFTRANDSDFAIHTSTNLVADFNLSDVFIKIEKPENDEIYIRIIHNSFKGENGKSQIYYTIKFICFPEIVKQIWNKFNHKVYKFMK